MAYHGTSRTGARDLAQQARAYLAEKEGIDMPTRSRSRRLRAMTTVADHWWWRPGWRPGRRMYTFHVTFADQPDVLKVAGARERLAGLPGLDLIPPQWLHLTTQSVGFTDEVSDADVTAIAAAARHLAAIQPPRVTIGPARVASEGIAMPVTPAGSLDPLRDGLRAAIAEVWSPAAVPETQEWTPHVSIAYSNVTGPAGTYLAALDEEDTTAAMDVRAVQLIILGRDSHLYEWTTCAEAQLRGGRGDAAGLRGAG